MAGSRRPRCCRLRGRPPRFGNDAIISFVSMRRNRSGDSWLPARVSRLHSASSSRSLKRRIHRPESNRPWHGTRNAWCRPIGSSSTPHPLRPIQTNADLKPKQGRRVLLTAQSGELDSTCGAATSNAPDPTILELPLRFGATTRGRLRVRPRAQGVKALRKETIDRLTMLCTLGACALERIDYRRQWPEQSDRLATSEELHDPSRDAGRPTGTSSASNTRLHDATFLSAILPFALNQARRHNEPLSLICLAIDRLTGMQELLGRRMADHLVRSVGETVASLIRASDIVARLDDDRVIAVLPRAPGGGALHVAQKICASIAEQRYEDCEISRVTVSIGVATFPACADDVSSLFDAADEALSQARSLGRNQAILAPRLPSPPPSSPGAHSSPWLSTRS